MRLRRRQQAPEGMTPAATIAWTALPPEPASAQTAATGDPELLARRDALVERFALGQADLGGIYYEMAIRDHVRDEVLAARAAELQQTELELVQVERLLSGQHGAAGGNCPVCGSLAGTADAFCSQCGHPLHDHTGNGNGASA